MCCGLMNEPVKCDVSTRSLSKHMCSLEGLEEVYGSTSHPRKRLFISLLILIVVKDDFLFPYCSPQSVCG